MSENLPEVRSTFRERAKAYNQEAEWVRDERLLQLIAPEPFGTGAACDYCAGTGVVAEALHNRGWKVTAVDISHDMLESIGRQNISRLVCDATATSLPSGAFDLLVCRQGLQYLRLAAAFGEMKRLSNREIRLAHITTESEAEDTSWRAYFRVASPGRLHVFHPDQLQKACTSAGLRIRTQEVLHTWGPFLGPIRHLPDQRQRWLLQWLHRHSDMMRRNYGLHRREDGELWYSQRWEVIEATATSRA